MKDVIDLSKSRDIPRVVRNAVLDDVAPLPSGSVFQYWQGETDLDPHSARKQVFDAVRGLWALGRVTLFQRRLGNGVYSYLAEVK